MARPQNVLSRFARGPDLTLRYGPLVDHVIDVRLPDDRRYDGRRPLVVVIHGGFWRIAYDRTHAGPQSAALADAGYVVATIEYRRVGPRGGGWPETFDDVSEVVNRVSYLVSSAAACRVAKGPPVLVGHSAGGHLALWAAARHRLPSASRWRRPGRHDVAGVVCLAGVTDLVQADGLRLGGDATRALLRGSATGEPTRYATTSPAALLPIGVPTALLHGADDDVVPVELSREYAHRASYAGDDVQLRELPGIGHYELIDPSSSGWPHLLSAVESVLAAR